ncbi:polysaccharide pyruvyl transferase family protein [Aeromicrobium sp. CF4.19]|uniref:polysaccharide pyruvyl transferase family protein n=1 Tax=Aeromicrobium sp. CF4.19 TaxID=3373082 RepID=UPI003EE689E1
MTRRILVRSGKEPWVSISPEATLEANVLGGNCGNLLFSTGVFASLSVEGADLRSDYFQIDRVDGADRIAGGINDEFDHVVIPFANALRPSFVRSLERWSAVVERLSVPVTVVGMGAQMAMDRDAVRSDERVDRAASRFLTAVLERGASVGVRGERTAEYLATLGFGDDVIDVIGCPSLYRPDIPVRMRKQVDALTRESRVALTLRPELRDDPLLAARLGEWVDANLAEREATEYVPQDNQDLRHLLWASGLSRDSRRDLPLHPDHPLMTSEQTKFFVDELTWRTYLSDVDMVVGNRIHGAVAGVLAGVPSMTLPFDSRVSELSEFHRLPLRPLRSITKEDTPASLYAEIDVEAFNSHHGVNEAGYRAFLERNGLEHAFGVDNPTGGFTERMASFTPAPAVVPVAAGCDSPGLLDRLEYLRRLAAGPAKETVARRYPSWVKAAPALVATDTQQRLSDLEGRTGSQFRDDRRRVYSAFRRLVVPVVKRVRRS